MNCKDLEELLSAYADGELPRTQKEFIEEHLDGCATCAATLADFTASGRLLSSLKAVPGEPDIREATISKIKANIHGNALWRWGRPSLAIGVAIIVLAVLLVVQPWSFITPETAAASIIRNSPEIQSFFDGEQVEDVEVTTKVIGNEGDVLVVLVKTETRAAAAEVDLKKKVITDIVRVHVPELTAMDEQRVIEIAGADPRVQDLLSDGGIFDDVSIFHSVNIQEVTGPDGKVTKEGFVEILGEVTIESGDKKWFVTVDLDENEVLGIAWPSAVMLVLNWSELIYSYLNPLLALLGVLVIAGLALKNKPAGAAAGVVTIVLGILSLYGRLYAWPVGLGDQIIALIPPALGLIIGIMDVRRGVKRRWVPVTGMVLCSLMLVYHLVNFICLVMADTIVP